MTDSCIKYDSSVDTLKVEVDRHPGPDNIITSEPIEHVVVMVLNSMTGGLVEFEIMGLQSDCLDDKISDIQELMQYDPESDSLSIQCIDEDQDGLCDLLYHDKDSQILITINRNKIGNLVGLEICGISESGFIRIFNYWNN